MIFGLMHHSGGGAPVALSDYGVDDVTIGATAEAGIQFNSDGSITFTGSSVPSSPANEWFRGQPSSGWGSGWSVRCSASTNDDPDNGKVVGDWYALSSDQYFRLQDTSSSPPTANSVWTFEIRHDATGAVVASSDVTITAEFAT